MGKNELLALRYSLEALTIDFWHEVDANGGREAARFYTEDALFETSIASYQGREAIHAFYNRRQARGPRLSLHVVQNFRIHSVTPDSARCEYILSLFAADGEPVLASRPAIMIAIAEESVIRQPGGEWLFTQRRLRPLFRDETPTTG